MEQRILLLADSASPHTEKWAVALAEKGFTVGIFSLNNSAGSWHECHSNILLLNEPERPHNKETWLSKLAYPLALPKLLRKIKAFRPHVLHAHYATSYGLLGALSRFRPFVISAWGSDVFEFPHTSPVHEYLLKFNLKRADALLATSHALKTELQQYTGRPIGVIPFGVNTERFSPAGATPPGVDGAVRIGLIKSIEDKYGIATVLDAALLVKTKLPTLNFELYLVGGGTRLDYYKERSTAMGLDQLVTFTGKIPFSKIPEYHNFLDIFLNVSIVNESFGVSVIEAMACEKPVIVTNAPGLTEIVNHEDLGIIVNKDNAEQLAGAMMRLSLSPALRLALGKAGRQHVLRNYDFSLSLEQTIALYRSFTGKTGRWRSFSRAKHQPFGKPVT